METRPGLLCAAAAGAPASRRGGEAEPAAAHRCPVPAAPGPAEAPAEAAQVRGAEQQVGQAGPVPRGHPAERGRGDDWLKESGAKAERSLTRR